MPTPRDTIPGEESYASERFIYIIAIKPDELLTDEDHRESILSRYSYPMLPMKDRHASSKLGSLISTNYEYNPN